MIKFSNVVNTICFLSICIFFSNQLRLENQFIYRIMYSILLVWGLNNLITCIKNLF